MRARLRKSFAAVVVGRGTPRSRAASSARTRSFCIIRMSNHTGPPRIDDERSPPFDRGRADRAGDHPLDGPSTVNPAALRQQDALTEGDDLLGEADVDGQLQQQSVPVPPDPDDRAEL